MKNVPAIMFRWFLTYDAVYSLKMAALQSLGLLFLAAVKIIMIRVSHKCWLDIMIMRATLVTHHFSRARIFFFLQNAKIKHFCYNLLIDIFSV